MTAPDDDNMVERVAMRLYRADGFMLAMFTADKSWAKDREDVRDRYRYKARAVIDAMREPTDAMLIGARDWSYKKYGKPVGQPDATGCWQSMIDAALL